MKEPPFPTRDDLINGWIDLCHMEQGSDEYEEAFWSCMFFDRLLYNFPLEAYQIIKEIVAKDSSHAVLSSTGTTLLASLIGDHGEKLIDDLEKDVESNENLKKSLEGIFNAGTSDEVWSRIQCLVDID